jgi:hypothetical protein
MSNPTDSTVRSLLISEANSRHGLALQVGTVQFTNITLPNPSIVDFSNSSLRNTSLQIVAGNLQDGGIAVDVNYNRLFLPKVAFPYSLTFDDQGEENIFEFLPRLALRLNRTLESSEFTNTEFVADGEDRTAVLSARSNSLVYFGQLTITLVANGGSDFFETESGAPLETENDIQFQVEVP